MACAIETEAESVTIEVFMVNSNVNDVEMKRRKQAKSRTYSRRRDMVGFKK